MRSNPPPPCLHHQPPWLDYHSIRPWHHLPCASLPFPGPLLDSPESPPDLAQCTTAHWLSGSAVVASHADMLAACLWRELAASSLSAACAVSSRPAYNVQSTSLIPGGHRTRWQGVSRRPWCRAAGEGAHATEPGEGKGGGNATGTEREVGEERETERGER